MDSRNSKKILMCDYRNVGHHWVYNYSVMKSLRENNYVTYFTSELDEAKRAALEEENIKYIELGVKESGNKLVNNYRILKWIYKSFKFAKSNGFTYVHFFTLDFIIPQLVFLRVFCGKLTVTSTLHWVPNNKGKLYLLKICLNNIIERVVVHGSYIRSIILSNFPFLPGIKVQNIDYPSFTTNEPVSRKGAYELANLAEDDRKILLYFGEMRYDKGVDILLESLKYSKNKFRIIIAGKAAFFSNEYISNLCEKHNNIVLNIGFINDELMEAYFTISDIVVLPYRKMFSGQSGPLTDGVKHNKMIISPNIGQIGYTVEHYKLGKNFEAENPVSLAQTIDECVENYESFMLYSKENFESYNKATSKGEFLKKYNELFNSI